MKELKTDVLVIGGGAAGVFAAISAARSGADTVLVEKNGILGGTVTTARVNYPGLFYAWGKRVIDGPCWESIERCVDMGGATLPDFPYKSKNHFDQQIRLDVFTYACVLDEMCKESGVRVLFHSMIADVEDGESGVKALIATKEGLRKISAGALIDASGDANAVRMAGYPCVRSENLQPATLINEFGGYDPDDVDECEFRAFLDELYASGELTHEDSQGFDLYKQIKKKHINMHISGEGADTSEGRGELEVRARASLMRIIKALSKFKGLEGIRIYRFGSECGVRETNRIVGESTLTCEDYVNGRVMKDAICHAFYPVDLHQPIGIKQIFLEDGVVPCIPYGALIPKNSHRILAAGRCISSDSDANSAIRVQASCMAMGQAAGVAAAIAAARGIDAIAVDTKDIKNGLTSLGAVVPNGDSKE